jgi:hypothetical protein
LSLGAESQQQKDGTESQQKDALSKAVNEAEGLRKRAKELREEAEALEAALTGSRRDLSKQRHKESDALIQQLFSSYTTTSQLVERLVQERWSPEQLMVVVERLHERQVQALGRSNSVGTPEEFVIGDTRNSGERNEGEWRRLDNFIESLLEATGVLDNQTVAHVNPNHRWTGQVASSLKSRLKELRRGDEQEFQRRLAARVNAVANSNSSASVEELVRKSLGLPVAEERQQDKPGRSFNISRVLEQVTTNAVFPCWRLLAFCLIGRFIMHSRSLLFVIIVGCHGTNVDSIVPPSFSIDFEIHSGFGGCQKASRSSLDRDQLFLHFVRVHTQCRNLSGKHSHATRCLQYHHGSQPNRSHFSRHSKSFIIGWIVGSNTAVSLERPGMATRKRCTRTGTKASRFGASNHSGA